MSTPVELVTAEDLSIITLDLVEIDMRLKYVFC